MIKRTKGFKGFRRRHWFVGDPAARAAHDGMTPLTRGWREGEPVLQMRVLVVPRSGASHGGKGPEPLRAKRGRVVDTMPPLAAAVYRASRTTSSNKFSPHQGKREIARRKARL